MSGGFAFSPIAKSWVVFAPPPLPPAIRENQFQGMGLMHTPPMFFF